MVRGCSSFASRYGFRARLHRFQHQNASVPLPVALRFDTTHLGGLVVALGTERLVKPFHLSQSVCVVAKGECFSSSQVDCVVHMEQPFDQRTARFEHAVRELVFAALDEFGIAGSTRSTRQYVLKTFEKPDIPRCAVFSGGEVQRDAMEEQPGGGSPDVGLKPVL